MTNNNDLVGQENVQSDAMLSEKNTDNLQTTTQIKEKPLSTSPALSSSGSENGDTATAEKAEVAPGEQKSPRDIHGIKWTLAVSSILASAFLFALDNTIVADVQPAIVKRFGEVNKLPWLSVAFLVAAAGTNLVW